MSRGTPGFLVGDTPATPEWASYLSENTGGRPSPGGMDTRPGAE